jgi:hypothetical protein
MVFNPGMLTLFPGFESVKARLRERSNAEWQAGTWKSHRYVARPKISHSYLLTDSDDRKNPWVMS